ncbi:peptidoglycan DD-metalloendopeptidase family protein [Nocardioides bigeumensis]|uniref:M23 family metallopeptidase n=1 Tax=Nocardioides bigeumensis TaxID=433657 RepID=A0ABP5JP06_9ACTN
MRTFPRAVRRRVGVTALAVALAAGVAAVPTAQAQLSAASFSAGDKADRLKKQKKQAEQDVDHAHEEFEFSSKKVVSAHLALESARADLSAARSHLDDTRDRLVDAQAKDLEMKAALVDAQTELDHAELSHDVGEVEVSHQKAEVAELIADIYREGDPDLNAFSSLLNAESPADLVRGDEGRRVVVGTQTQAYDDLSAAELLLAVREDEVSAARDDVAKKAEDAAEQVKVVEGLEREAETAKDDVVRLVSERKSAKEEAQRLKKWDRFQWRKAQRDQARIEAQLKELARKARLRALRKAQERARANQTAPGNTGGFLNRPVPGPVTSSFGMRIHPIYGYYGLHDGTDFGVACGEPMYAAADGRVVAEYYQTAYGNRLVVNHGFQQGVGLATIYNHAASYTVSVGDSVARGQVIGYVGDTGWSTGCHLHFTVMVNGRAVDPMNWL